MLTPEEEQRPDLPQEDDFKNLAESKPRDIKKGFSDRRDVKD
jgi:hypothetical protein